MGGINYEPLPLTAAGYGWGPGGSFIAMEGLDSQYTFPLQTPQASVLPSVREGWGLGVWNQRAALGDRRVGTGGMELARCPL